MEQDSLLVGLHSEGGDVDFLLGVLGVLKVGFFHVKHH